LPEALRAPDLVPTERSASDYAAFFWGLVSLVGIPMFLYRHWKNWRSRHSGV